MRKQFRWWLLIPFMCIVPKKVEWITDVYSYEAKSNRLLWIYINMLITIVFISIGILSIIL